MFLIVLHHCWIHGPNQNGAAWYPIVFGLLIIWHVDCFVAISGWFGVRFSWWKFFSIWGQCAFYTALSAAYVYVFDRPSFSMTTLTVFGGWFGGAYLMLLFVAPFINASVDKLAADSGKVLAASWFALTVAFVCNVAPYKLMSGIATMDAGPCSFLTMGYVYLSARCLRVLDWRFMTMRNLVLAFAGFVCVTALLIGVYVAPVLSKGLPVDWWRAGRLTNYCALHVVIAALAVMMCFARVVHVHRPFARMVSLCAPSMFGVYLVSDTTSFGRDLFICWPQQWLSGVGVSGAAGIVMTAIFAFFVCIAIDMVRRALCRFVGSGIRNILEV